jgi:hypothetical protein
VNYLLDTNIVSEMRKYGTPKMDRKFRKWVDKSPSDSACISAISLMELEIGVLKIERRDARQGRVLRAWLDDYVLPGFSGRVLPVDTAVALRSAKLHVPDPCSDRDAYIAATALVHGLTVVTRNTRDFEGTGAKVLNPWEG